MSEERPQPENIFSFTERERLFERISDARFQELLEDERTTVHRIELSANSYGEFLFVSLSLPQEAERPVGERASIVTLWGLGYHDYRERWIHQEWAWYRAYSRPELVEQMLDKEAAQKLLEERRNEIVPYVSQITQSKRGKLYELLADLLDEDGALTEIEDMGDLDDLPDDWL